MEEIVWEDPPAPKRGHNGMWVERLAPLVERPGEWARVKGPTSESNARATANNLKDRKIKIPDGKWEVVARHVDGKGYVWARYLGK